MGFELILHDYLSRCLALGLHILSYEAVGESTLAKESTFLVLPDHLLAIDPPNVFIDDVSVFWFVFALGEVGGCAFVFGNTHDFYRILKIIRNQVRI